MTTPRVTRSRMKTSVNTPSPISSTDREEIGLGVKSSEKIRKPKFTKKSKSSSSKRSDKFDAFKPKKPPTAFFYFLEDFRKEFQEKNPDVKSMRDVGKACGEKWKTMAFEEKVNYYDIATEKRADFDRAMADYIKRKENGEFLEFEEDADFDG